MRRTVIPVGRRWWQRQGRSVACGFILLLLLSACGSTNSSALTISGSTSVSPFVERLAGHYNDQHPGQRVDVQSLGSSAGIRAAIDGTSEVGMSSRELEADEAEQLEELLIARDALALIVHPSNPVTNLTLAQVQAIFGGSITSWAEVGGPSQRITVVVREAGSGTAGAFDELVMKGAPANLAALRQGSNGAIRQIVSKDPNSIGYISLGIVDPTVKSVAIDGVQPTVEEVDAGNYAFVRPFLFVWRKGHQLSPLAGSFVDYVMSPEAQDELVGMGLVRGQVRQ